MLCHQVSPFFQIKLKNLDQFLHKKNICSLCFVEDKFEGVLNRKQLGYLDVPRIFSDFPGPPKLLK